MEQTNPITTKYLIKHTLRTCIIFPATYLYMTSIIHSGAVSFLSLTTLFALVLLWLRDIVYPWATFLLYDGLKSFVLRRTKRSLGVLRILLVMVPTMILAVFIRHPIDTITIMLLSSRGVELYPYYRPWSGFVLALVVGVYTSIKIFLVKVLIKRIDLQKRIHGIRMRHVLKQVLLFIFDIAIYPVGSILAIQQTENESIVYSYFHTNLFGGLMWWTFLSFTHLLFRIGFDMAMNNRSQTDRVKMD